MKKAKNVGAAPGHEREPCPGLPEDFDLKDYTSARMTNWFSPVVLFSTGARDLLSQIFAAYADRRATIAALQPASTFDDLKDRDELWLDYVADVGDGWDSTYSIAWCLGQLKQTVNTNGAQQQLQRGDMLVMGGDQVYPFASAEAYNTRLVRPYQAALPCTPEGEHPVLFALPGNHDWTDGLRGFMRRFCQGAWLGGWRTHQSRPYWSVQLPHGWWIWGVDSQIDDYIDQAQVDFFRQTAENVQAGDRVILCVAAPSWIYAATGDNELYRNLAFLENDIICKRKAHLVLTLSGDLHHFAHYRTDDGRDGIMRHKITCGGGGAFTHGTHHLPKRIDLVEQNEDRSYELDAQPLPDGTGSAKVLPGQGESKRLLWKNLLFPLRHPAFAALLGGFYLVYALVLANAGLLQQLALVPFEPGNTALTFWLYIKTTFAHVWPLLFLGLLIGSGYAFAQPDWRSNPEVKRKRKLCGGLVHALMHLVVLIPLLWTLSHSSTISLPPFAPDWTSALKYSLATFFFGALGGGLVFGIYLSASNLLAGFHRTEAFSAVRDANNKSFLRMHLNKDGLTIYPLGLSDSECEWKENPEGGENSSWIHPAGDKPLVPDLICGPIRIDN